MRIGNDGEELAAHPNGEEWSVFLCPIVYYNFRILIEKSIANRWSWRQGVSTLVTNPLAENNGRQKVDGREYHHPNSDDINEVGSKPGNFAYVESHILQVKLNNLAENHKLLYS